MESTLEDRIWQELFKEAQQFLREGNHENALKDFRGALNVAEKFGEDDTRLVQSISGLALAHSVRHEFKDAEPLFKRAVVLTEKTHGPNHPDVAKVLKHLALIYSSQKKYENAEEALQRAIKICEDSAPNHPDLGTLRQQHEKVRQSKVAEVENKRSGVPELEVLKPLAMKTPVTNQKTTVPTATNLQKPNTTTPQPPARPSLRPGATAPPGGTFDSDQASSAASLSSDSLIGTVIDNRYEVIDRLADGGMSVIYKGRHTLMDRPVAIKILHPHLVSNVRNIHRFKNEAQTASSLTHQNICSVRDFGVTGNGLAYMIMDCLEGENIAELITKLGFIPADRFIKILKQICDGLAYAHENGVLHRDLKPSNVMLISTAAKKDVVKIVDFGIAKLVSKEEGTLELTQTGEVVGSPLYMSPEQCHGEPLDERSDIYSLGCLSYKSLIGCPPFLGRSNVDVYMKHVSEQPSPFKVMRPDITVPPGLEAIVLKMLEKKGADRQKSMVELRESLDSVKF